MSVSAGTAGLPFDPSTLPLDVQMEVGAKMVLGAHPVKNFAPYLLGMWLDAFLLGCLIMLFAKWKRHAYQTERLIIKILMIYLLVVSIGISCYILSYQMFLFVSGFGVYKNFINPNWSKVFYTINTTSRMPAAAFFVHRAWMLCGKRIIFPIVMIPLLLASMGCAIAATITSTHIPINAREHATVIAFLCTEVTADVINTITISIGLFRSRTGWKATDRLISRLIIIGAETQLPPTLTAIGFLACFLGWPDTTAIALFTAAPKVHVICLAIVLNSRIKMKGEYLSGHDSENSYQLKSKPTVTIETYIHAEKTGQDDTPAIHTGGVGIDGMRTDNGRSVVTDRRSFYQDSDSKSSLV